MITFESSVEISRPPADVFRYVADSVNAAAWNSAVREVRKVSDGPVGEGTEYWMSRDLRQGRAENTLRVIEYDRDRAYAIRTTSGPTPFHYRYRFEPSDFGTRVILVAQADLGIPRLLSPLASAAVKRGVEANFRTLKGILETRA